MEPDYSQFATAPDDSAEDNVPSYLLTAADNHNIGNGNSSWYNPTTWDPVGTVIGAGKFAAVSLASGVNSFYNTGVAVNNWFGGTAEYNDTSVWISTLDDDLGQYYAENKEAADLVGFIATSLIPGTAGVKVFNAGQKALNAARQGWVGTNMSKATGLLVPSTEKYVQLAAAELAQGTATFGGINANTLKALGAGAGQAALESAVFETAVAATMFKSPILEEMDVGDIVKNIAVGTALGGAIGGAFTGAKTFSSIKSVVKEADKAEKPFTQISEFPGASASDRIIARFDDLDNMKAVEIDPSSDFADKFTRLSKDKETKLMNLARQDMHTLTVGKDSEVANMLADSLQGVGSGTVMKNMLHAKEISRVGVEGTIDKLFKKAVSALDIEATKNIKSTYVQLIGDAPGAVLLSKPAVLNIADTVKTSADVIKKVDSYGFKVKDPFEFTKIKSHFDAEARYIWADSKAVIKDDTVIGMNDIPLMEKALFSKAEKVKIKSEDGSVVEVGSSQELFETIKETKDRLAFELLETKKFTTEEIAKITNTKLSYLEGAESSDVMSDLFARQDSAKKYTQGLIEKGIWSESKGVVDISTKPSYVKIGYDTTPLKDIDGNVFEGMAIIKEKQKIYQQGIDNVFVNNTEELSSRFWHPDEKLLLQANRYGAGPGLFSFANGSYHSLESWAESIGSASNALLKKLTKNTTETLDPVAYKLSTNQAAAIEFESINSKIAGTTEKYVLNQDGTALVARKLRDYQEALAQGKTAQTPKLQAGAPAEIPINSIEAQEAVAAHISMQGKRTKGFQEVRNAQGLEDFKDTDTFYPMRPNPKNYPHFAFVVDPTVTGTGHVSMIHAATEKELEALIGKVPGSYKTITKAQTEEYYKAIDDFKYERTLHENYIDSDLKSRGINTPFFQKTDPSKIAADFMEHHVRGESVFARELINAKFEKEFTELRRLGEQYTNVASSKYGSNVRTAENVTKNPYLNYVKTALDISQMSEYPLLQGFNTIMDKSFSRAFTSISEAWTSVKSPADLELVNKELQRNGVKTAYYDSALDALANHTAPQGILRDFVGKANSLIATLVLRLDPLNAVNNTVGANVLLGAETQHIIRGIQAGDTTIAGELAQLAKVKVPGTEDMILSPTKIIASSMRRYFSDEGKELISLYKQNGWITDLTEQYKSMLDDLTLRGTESSGELKGKIDKAFLKAKQLGDSGEKLTGNRFAEEFNRFVAADVMKQISDLGIKAGVIDQSVQLSYINTFVNRTQGNVLASQRPLMFQGAVGQAVGLFQTYQFNMIQQLLRYAGEGSKKDIAALLGLQGTIYGMNGLPAFNFINQHIVGTASGNPQHKDLYTATYGTVGKDMGDWLLYGIPSNMLKTNLYTRGDINPRHVTIIPTNPADVPIYSATAGFLANLKDTVGKIQAGGDVWQTMLQGIEHNGVSRPLAGLAQTLQSAGNGGTVIATDKKGNISGANDLMSLTTLARLAGGKPFDEAITNDAVYRVSAYTANDNDKKQKLTETIKSSLIKGDQPDEEQMNGFIKSYVGLGGKQRDFNRHVMELYKQANTTQSNRLAENMNSPYAQYMQRVMGGAVLRDGRGSTEESEEVE